MSEVRPVNPTLRCSSIAVVYASTPEQRILSPGAAASPRVTHRVPALPGSATAPCGETFSTSTYRLKKCVDPLSGGGSKMICPQWFAGTRTRAKRAPAVTALIDSEQVRQNVGARTSTDCWAGSANARLEGQRIEEHP